HKRRRRTEASTGRWEPPCRRTAPRRRGPSGARTPNPAHHRTYRPGRPACTRRTSMRARRIRSKRRTESASSFDSRAGVNWGCTHKVRARRGRSTEEARDSSGILLFDHVLPTVKVNLVALPRTLVTIVLADLLPQGQHFGARGA